MCESNEYRKDSCCPASRTKKCVDGDLEYGEEEYNATSNNKESINKR
jgi:hypothetical protein